MVQGEPVAARGPSLASSVPVAPILPKTIASAYISRWAASASYTGPAWDEMGEMGEMGSARLSPKIAWPDGISNLASRQCAVCNQTLAMYTCQP